MQRRVGAKAQRAVGEAAVGRETEPLKPHARSPMRKSRASATRSAAALASARRNLGAQLARQFFGDARHELRDDGGEFGIVGGGGDEAVDVERVGLGLRRPRAAAARVAMSQPLDPAIGGRPESRARAPRPRNPSRCATRRACAGVSPVSVTRTASGRPSAACHARGRARRRSAAHDLGLVGDSRRRRRSHAPSAPRRARRARPRRCGRPRP